MIPQEINELLLGTQSRLGNMQTPNAAISMLSKDDRTANPDSATKSANLGIQFHIDRDIDTDIEIRPDVSTHM